MKKYRLGEMTVHDVREYLKYNQTLILPYGVVEQHGYHLPLDTDIRNAEILGENIAEKLDCIVAPTLNYCFSGGMLPGTINVKPNTFSNFVGEIIESLVLQGFRNIIILPGHGGSESVLHLKESLRILKWLNPAMKDAMILMTPPWDFSPTWLDQFKSRDYHGGAVETSLIKHWTPEVVRDEIVMDDPETSEMMREDPDSFQLRTAFTEMSQEVPSTEQREAIEVGIMGYPEKASEELGEKVTQEILDNIVPALQSAIRAADESRKIGKRIEIKDNQKLKIIS
jgi:creatinine amidohydrolase